jgi:hypothetical protein
MQTEIAIPTGENGDKFEGHIPRIEFGVRDYFLRQFLIATVSNVALDEDSDRISHEDRAEMDNRLHALFDNDELADNYLPIHDGLEHVALDLALAKFQKWLADNPDVHHKLPFNLEVSPQLFLQFTTLDGILVNNSAIHYCKSVDDQEFYEYLKSKFEVRDYRESWARRMYKKFVNRNTARSEDWDIEIDPERKEKEEDGIDFGYDKYHIRINERTGPGLLPENTTEDDIRELLDMFYRGDDGILRKLTDFIYESYERYFDVIYGMLGLDEAELSEMIGIAGDYIEARGDRLKINTDVPRYALLQVMSYPDLVEIYQFDEDIQNQIDQRALARISRSRDIEIIGSVLIHKKKNEVESLAGVRGLEDVYQIIRRHRVNLSDINASKIFGEYEADLFEGVIYSSLPYSEDHK